MTQLCIFTFQMSWKICCVPHDDLVVSHTTLFSFWKNLSWNLLCGTRQSFMSNVCILVETIYFYISEPNRNIQVQCAVAHPCTQCGSSLLWHEQVEFHFKIFYILKIWKFDKTVAGSKSKNKDLFSFRTKINFTK